MRRCSHTVCTLAITLMPRMKPRLFLLCAMLAACSAWAQQGGGPPPRGGFVGPGGASFNAPGRDDGDPRRQRDELRSLIRDQRRADLGPEYPRSNEHASRQLSREEREALREQLRRQHPEGRRREP